MPAGATLGVQLTGGGGGSGQYSSGQNSAGGGGGYTTGFLSVSAGTVRG